ncbi:MAG: hypothetical protein ACLQGP_03195 [Isosphaeraceae bacterium]
MASEVYQDYLGRPLKLGRDGKAVPYVEPPVKAPKPPRPAKATKKGPASAEVVGPGRDRRGSGIGDRVRLPGSGRWSLYTPLHNIGPGYSLPLRGVCV